MEKHSILGLSFILIFATSVFAAATAFETDTIKTSRGDLAITFIGHGTLMMAYGGIVIHIDPVMASADYAKLP
jgi:hypothetical protein